MAIVDLLIISSRQVIRNGSRYQAVLVAVVLGLAGLTVLFTMGDSIEKRSDKISNFSEKPPSSRQDGTSTKS